MEQRGVIQKMLREELGSLLELELSLAVRHATPPQLAHGVDAFSLHKTSIPVQNRVFIEGFFWFSIFQDTATTTPLLLGCSANLTQISDSFIL